MTTLYNGNHPPWKQHFIFLTIIMPGLGHLGKYTDVMLLPHIDELKLLRDKGFETYDVDQAQHVILRVALMWTISNFLLYDR